ncbi:hypothetical protein PG991_013245 [Apiospora marii]|uniref:Zn(2)-C6 fungal-type domain-containing protein n=1 Tax=Apiospora marii TaxID=335849 RepID=A0ABR1R5S6_9PEZI
MTTEPRPQLMDNPDFQSFLDATPESDPTTLQSLLLETSDSNCKVLSQSVPLLDTEPVEHNDPSHNVRMEPTQSFHIVQPSSTSATVTVCPHQDTPGPRNGKRKLPSLQQMQNDDCILRLYGESTGRRHKRQKKKGRQCTRCRLKNLKCSDGFPCTSCMEHWKKATNWATEKRMMAWSHCFDARLEDLNVLTGLTHSIMFARTHPRKRSRDMKRHYLTGSFEQICFIRELVDSLETGPGLREYGESQNSGLLVCEKTQKSKPSAPPLSLLIQDIQKQLPSDPWTLTPTAHRSLARSDRPFIRLSEIVTIMFLHHDYLLKHTNLGSYELYCLSLAVSDMFFEQIIRHFRTGKIHAIPIGSPQATELAIDLGTLFMLICHGPSHFQYADLVDSTDAPWTISADLEDEKAIKISKLPDNILATPEAERYLLNEIDRFFTSDSSKMAQGRQLPFKAATLPNRWAFLKDYLSHWVNKVALCSAEPSTVTSRLVLAQKLCRLRLLDNDGNHSTCPRSIVNSVQAAAEPMESPEGVRDASWFHRRQKDVLLANAGRAMADSQPSASRTSIGIAGADRLP